MAENAERNRLPTKRDIFAVAWPLALKASMLHGIIVIDSYLVSSLGEAAIASLGLAGAIAGLFLAFMFAFSSAAQIRVAQAFGSQEPRLLKSAFLCSLFINLAILAVGLVIIWAFADRILAATAATPEIAVQAQAYLAAFLMVFVAEAISQSVGSFFNGCGKTHIPLTSYAVALPVNVTVSYGFIHGMFGLPELGIVGAAVGTSFAASLRLCIVGAWLLRTYRSLLQTDGWQRGSFGNAFKAHFVFTLPIATTFVSMGIANHVSILIYSQMSVVAFAAMVVILPWIQVGGTIAMSWAQATGILVAQLLGRKAGAQELDQFLSSAWRTVFIAALPVALFLACLSLLAGHIYPELQQETIKVIASFLPILLILPFIKCTNAVCGNTLRAAGDTVYVMNIFLGSVWLFRLPVMATAVIWWEVNALWIMLVLLLEEVVKFPWFHSRMFAGKWKTADVFA